jgi:hypothetical protein
LNRRDAQVCYCDYEDRQVNRHGALRPGSCSGV